MTLAIKTAIDAIRTALVVSSIFKQFDKYEVRTTRGSDVMMSCPFHSDSSPSLSLNDTIKRWHCFSCGRGGDVIAAYAELSALSGNPMSYYAALRVLVQETPGIGVSVEQLKERKILTMDNNTTAFRWKPTKSVTWSDLYNVVSHDSSTLFSILDLYHTGIPLETIYEAFNSSTKLNNASSQNGLEAFDVDNDLSMEMELEMEDA